MVNALSQEIRIKNGVPLGSVIGPLVLLLSVNDLLSVINVLTLLFANDLKMVSARSQSGLLQSFFYKIWKLSVNWAPPLLLSFATGSPGDSIQVTNVAKVLDVIVGSFFLTIHPLQRDCQQSKAYVVYDKTVVR